MKVVVITRDQPLEIPKFEECLKGFDHIYVIDRPSVEYPAGIPAIYNFSGDGFLAGRMRDLGALSFAGEDILFLDGDKVPQGDLSAVENAPFDCVLLGVQNDKREYFDGTTHSITLPDIHYQELSLDEVLQSVKSSDFKLENYVHNDTLKAPMAV